MQPARTRGRAVEWARAALLVVLAAGIGGYGLTAPTWAEVRARHTAQRVEALLVEALGRTREVRLDLQRSHAVAVARDAVAYAEEVLAAVPGGDDLTEAERSDLAAAAADLAAARDLLAELVAQVPSAAPGEPVVAPQPASVTPEAATATPGSTSPAPAPGASSTGITGAPMTSTGQSADPGSGSVSGSGSAPAALSDPVQAAAASAAALGGLTVPTDAAPDDAATVAVADALARLAARAGEVVDLARSALDAAAARAVAADELTAAQAEVARVAAQRVSLDRYPNGAVPLRAMCTPAAAPGHHLRCDAAEALDLLAAAYREALGAELEVTDSYRTLAQQETCAAEKPDLCAAAGTSLHGRGVAVDLGGTAHRAGTRAHDWLLAHATAFGWQLPDWARADGARPEPWHWEFVGPADAGPVPGA